MGDATKPEIWGKSTEEGDDYIYLEWHGHLNLGTWDRRLLTARVLHHRLGELRRRGGDFVCPVINLDRSLNYTDLTLIAVTALSMKGRRRLIGS
jgi:hypothetical protein